MSFSTFQDYKIDDFGYVRLPEIKITYEQKKNLGLPANANNFEFLKKLAENGFESKYYKFNKEKISKYREMLDFELNLVKELDFVDYYLLVWMVVNKINELGAFQDYGRGSAASSLIFWLIGASGVDPIDKELILSRFISKVRAKKIVKDGIVYIKGDLAPDVDLNIGGVRNEIISWLSEIYSGKIAKIVNLTTYTGKLLIKDVYKAVENASEEDAKEVSDLIEKNAGIVEDLEEMVHKSETFASWALKHPITFSIALKLRDIIKQKSTHASGYLISFDPLDGNFPLEMSKEKELVVGYNKDDVSNFSIKLDLLGLTSDEIVNDVIKVIPEKISDLNLDNDPFIYDRLQDGQLLPYGIYQLSADFAYRVAQKTKPRNIYELSDVNALARPGASAYIDDYSNYTAQEPIEVFKPILEKTRNVCLYQEQMMQMAIEVGFSPDESELLRRCVTSDTLFISKTRGYVSIDTLLKTGYENEEFLVMDELGQQKWKKIQNIWSNGKKQVRYVESRNGMNVKASRWHQFLTDKGWKARNYLDKDDYLVCAKEIHYDGQDLISEDLAIVIAGLVTEGYFVDDRSATFVNYDLCIRNRFVNAFHREFGENTLNLNNENIVCIRNNEKEKIKKYLKQGLSVSKHLPEIMLGMTIETTRKFLSYIFACEGTITKNELSLTSKSRKFINQLQLLLLRFGIRSNILIKNNKDYGSFYVLDIGEFSSVIKFYNELSIELQDYKKEKLYKYINKNCYKNNTTDVIPIHLLKNFKNQYGHTFNYDSGRCYSKNMSRTKFIRFAEASKDPLWIKFANGKQEYTRVENLEKEIREIEVFDFAIDEETPFIIANGLVIHNCVSKKKVDEIALWKDKIYENCQKNGFDQSIGDILWKILDDSSKYSFNASHSLSTSYLTALTIYLKYKYPKQFYLACLKNVQKFPNPIEEIRLIAGELPFFGLKLLPPNLAKSNLDFTIEENGIRFGLSSIKGISGKTLEKLKGFISSQTSNKFEVFIAAKEAKLNIGVLSALIQAGALDDQVKNRSKLVLEAQVWNILTEKEKIKCKELGDKFSYDIFSILKYLSTNIETNGKPFIKESRYKTIKKNFEKYVKIYNLNNSNEEFANWYYETNLLGYSYSQSLNEIFKKKIVDLITFNEIKGCVDGETVTFVGIIETAYKKTSNRGTKYLKIVVSDEFGNKLNSMIFSWRMDEFLENSPEPKEGNIILIRGTKKEGDSIFIEDAKIQDWQIYMKYTELKEEE